MDVESKYLNAFVSVFELEPSSVVDSLAYQAIDLWDSVGHMELMSTLEDLFSIELDIDDIIDFSSVGVGREILRKYGVEF